MIINADSMQVYADLRVLTARPSAAEEARVPHRLFGIYPAGQIRSAGLWLDGAVEAIKEARAAGLLPIVCGGTGFYLRALMQGLAPIPDIPDEVRQAVRARHAEIGGEAFHAEVAELDPETARRLPPSDSQRLMRAMEVFKGTGKTLGQWYEIPAEAAPIDARFVTVLLMPPRPELYRAIDERFEAMVEQGAGEEVKALLANGFQADLPAMKAVGVRELGAYQAGEITLEEAILQSQRASRNYAKRQFTWLRHQLEPDLSYDSFGKDVETGPILDLIRETQA